jgi:tRNA threonylcarbamoyladenosine biosynthesis protein TsaB
MSSWVKFVIERAEELDPLILAIETATRAGSVAVVRGEELLSSRAGAAEVSHSTNLIEMIEQALAEANTRLSDIDLFAVAVGPGSFTGLRIGLATVKALAASTARKIAGVSTLAAVAHAANISGDVVALLPAGRGEVFAQLFTVNNDTVETKDKAAHLTPKALWERYGGMQRLNWAGEEGSTIAEGLRLFGVPRLGGMPSEAGTPNCLAFSVAILAAKVYREGKSVAPDELHAVYVRASDAEINERWQQEKVNQPAQN